jgi:hypothetical protein
MAKSATAARETVGAPKDERSCALTLEEFLKAAKPISVKIGDQTLTANVKHFSTGSYGFYLNAPITLLVGDTAVEFQVGCNITARNSKPKAEE